MSEGSIIEYSGDLSQQEAAKPLPSKEYTGVVSKAEQKLSGSGNLGVQMTIHIDPDQYPADYPVEENPDGVDLTYWVGVEDTPRGRYRMRKVCEAFGVVPTKHVDVTEFIGRETTVTVGIQNFEGEDRNNVKKVTKQ